MSGIGSLHSPSTEIHHPLNWKSVSIQTRALTRLDPRFKNVLSSQ
jgi:hypothetical protein